MIVKAQEILKRVFGYKAFRPLQKEVIGSVLTGRDTLVVMPTGAGKSICYQIPALMSDRLTIVVSPLISLMKDQVEQLNALGVPAVCLNSSLSRSAIRSARAQVRNGEAKLLYMAPETLLMPATLEFLSLLPVLYLIIDEAHCISEWGHEFRPEYRHLVTVRERFPGAACMALTATATPRVQKDILNCLRLTHADLYIAGFDRRNLFLQIEPKTEPYFQIKEFLDRHPDQPGIVYCYSRKQVDDLTADLAADGYSVRPYHAGLEDVTRKVNQEAFIRDEARIMVATIAFGMGINKSNVRFVIHRDLPKNIESYYQQIGRAGRDGLHADCLLLFSYSDLQKNLYFIRKMSGIERQSAELHLSAMVRFAETGACRRRPLLSYFGEKPDFRQCGMCDNCAMPDRPLDDITVQTQMFLSCVRRTGEKFGVNYIIDVLRGSKSHKVLRFHHDRISTYGVGSAISRRTWQHYAAQLIARGILVQQTDYGSLVLTHRAWRVLRGEEPVMGTQPPDITQVSAIESEILNCDPVLFDMLKCKRRELAEEAEVPAYVIFPDRTLAQMACFYPCTEETLQYIYGVGEVKMENYGSVFLSVIRQYCRENGVLPDQLPKNHRRRGFTTVSKTDQPQTVNASGNRRWGETEI